MDEHGGYDALWRILGIVQWVLVVAIVPSGLFIVRLWSDLRQLQGKVGAMEHDHTSALALAKNISSLTVELKHDREQLKRQELALDKMYDEVKTIKERVIRLDERDQLRKD